MSDPVYCFPENLMQNQKHPNIVHMKRFKDMAEAFFLFRETKIRQLGDKSLNQHA